MGFMMKILRGFLSLLQGMAITFRAMFSKPVTQRYPHVEPELSKAYRSAIKLVRFDESDTHDCIACLQCEKICPSFCIKIDGYKPEGIKRKRATVFDMDFALCSLCGLCLDVCPTDTLEYSSLYDLTGYKRDVFNFDLLDTFREGEEGYLGRAREEQAVKDAEKEKLRLEKLATKKAAEEAKPVEAAVQMGHADGGGEPSPSDSE
jgi:formate hydrogenlyase subunit 6/NADH:ubiquinone oxidoreductase subunit I